MDFLSRLRAARAVLPAQRDVLLRRLPGLPKPQREGELLAIDPLDAVMERYPDPDEALRRAQVLQGSDPVQFLERGSNQGRWHDQAGVTSYEVPLMAYSGSVVPGERGAVGLHRSVAGRAGPPKAVIQLADSPQLDVAVHEESLHALDRLIGERNQYRPLDAPEATSAMLQAGAFPSAVLERLNYYAKPAEMRATLSQMLPGNRVDTPSQALELLDRMRLEGTARQSATSEALLRSKGLRNQYIPYLMKALGVGGVMASQDTE
jgi:hypothetical protein